jgi:glycosyltransferase involved in cell wall biosynthesis
MDGARLRVMFLSPYFRPYLGGIERAIERLSFQLLESPEVEAVGVLTTKYSFPPESHPEWADRERTPEGVAIFRLAGFPRQSLPLYSVPLVWFSPGQIRRYLDEFNPDVIHFVGDGWFWGHFWARVWRKGRARFVFTPSYHTLPPSRVWLKPVNRLLCRGMDRVVALTRQEAAQVGRDYGVSDEKLAVVGWGASAMGQVFNGSDGGNDDSGDRITILCVGRLSRHKGQAWLLEVYRRARANFRRPARLALVGRDEDAESELRARVKAAGLEDEVVFTGELADDELGRWYGKADIFALFSQYEAFGLVYFEAMLCGLPALTHAVGANRELLTHGAIVTPRYNLEAAASELARLVNEPEYRRRLGDEGREYASREFTWEAVAEKYLALYRG